MAINYDKIMAYRPEPIKVEYTRKDCIFYALSIGIGMDPMDRGQLKFVYEKELKAFPAMAGVLGWMGRSVSTNREFGIDQRLVVAADQRIVIHQPLAPEGKLIAHSRIREVIDKGPGGGAIVQSARELTAEDGTPFATVESSIFARNHGGFGGKVTSTPEPPHIPEGAPEKICDLPTPRNMALVYRLNGDTNPIHVDPERAGAAGFPRPILHGMASYGVAAHAVLRTFADYRPERFVSMEARYVKPVYPGETLRTEMWRRGDLVLFRCRVVERDSIALNNGLAVLKD